MYAPISFPGLGLSFNIQPVAFTIGSLVVSWYGIIIAVGLLLAMIYGLKRASQFKITADDLSDVIIFSIIAGIIGARLYYVLFFSDGSGLNPYFSNPISMLYIWQGGLGIYGGIIAAFLCAFIVCRVKKISVGAVFDIAALGFLIGQAIGRWGNFVNREAFGAQTSLPWRMVVDSTGTGYNPCFLYESLWCILGFVLLHIYSKRRKFNGEVFLIYLMWYGFGRFFIEALRTDSLMLGNLKISQLVAAALFVVAGGIWAYKRSQARSSSQQLDYTPVYEETLAAVDKDAEEVYTDEDVEEEDEHGSDDEAKESAETSDSEEKAENPEKDGDQQ